MNSGYLENLSYSWKKKQHRDILGITQYSYSSIKGRINSEQRKWLLTSMICENWPHQSFNRFVQSLVSRTISSDNVECFGDVVTALNLAGSH